MTLLKLTAAFSACFIVIWAVTDIGDKLGPEMQTLALGVLVLAVVLVAGVALYLVGRK